MGLAAAWALKRRGVEPVVYEQFRVGNDRGSSHGRSRIFRLAYAEDEYVRLAEEAFGLWRELESETGETLLELHGLVEVVRTLEESTAPTLERCGVAWERLDGDEAERRYPIKVPDESFVVVQRDAGIVRADKALRAFARGLDVREETRAHPEKLDADTVVVTAGSWVNELLEQPLNVKTTRETVCYFRPAGDRPVPSVVSFKPDRHTHDVYSLYDPKYGVKVGAHHAGPEDHGLGERDLPPRQARRGSSRDVHVHDDAGRDVRARAARPRRRRLPVLRPWLQVRPRDRRAACRARPDRLGRAGSLLRLKAGRGRPAPNVPVR